MVAAFHDDRTRKVRALLDTGATLSVISESLANALKLPRKSEKLILDGFGDLVKSKHYVQVDLRSCYPEGTPESFSVKCHVVSTLPYLRPPFHPKSILQLPCIKDKAPIADPELGGTLDLLLGAIPCVRSEKGLGVVGKGGEIIAKPTLFGWTLLGAIPESVVRNTIMHVHGTPDPLDQSLQRLWDLDQIPDLNTSYTLDEQSAVTLFKDTYRVTPSGRYQVQLPRVTDPPSLGTSRPAAHRHFVQNEKSLQGKGKLQDFEQVLKEYIELGHAEPVPEDELHQPSINTYYLPTHGVVKESSTTTKLRAVFDASAKSSNGISLNDQLFVGPNLNPLLTSVLTAFRCHRIAVTADISKMFREVELDPIERNFHRFLMRTDNKLITDYRMRHLTFGVKSSPFLATMVLLEHAERHQDTPPTAAHIISTSFYVDDCLSGAPTVEEAAAIRTELCDLLSLCGMTFRKWRSNSSVLLDTVPEALRETADLQLADPLSSSKTLGIHWHVATDNFHVAVPVISFDLPATKRNLASVATKVFDVLGLFSPAIITVKILLQRLWKLGLGWDDTAPPDIASSWVEWLTHVVHITEYPISCRLMLLDRPHISCKLHAFSDASIIAYGAVLYLRTLYDDSSVSVRLVVSKARVAPVKSSTVPRLELMAAHLLSKLVDSVVKGLDLSLSDVYAWTDSSIILAWLRGSASRLKTFITNRVRAIQEKVPGPQWRHVRTEDNPADMASRGISLCWPCLQSHLL